MNDTVDTQALPADAVDALPPHPKELEKEQNRIVPAYSFTDKNGKSISVSCPKRLLLQVQEAGVKKYGKGCRLALDVSSIESIGDSVNG